MRYDRRDWNSNHLREDYLVMSVYLWSRIYVYKNENNDGDTIYYVLPLDL